MTNTVFKSFHLNFLILKFYTKQSLILLVISTGGGGSPFVKVTGDVPPARVSFFWISILAKGILFGNSSQI